MIKVFVNLLYWFYCTPLYQNILEPASEWLIANKDSVLPLFYFLIALDVVWMIANKWDEILDYIDYLQARKEW
jgi:hypothetical protein